MDVINKIPTKLIKIYMAVCMVFGILGFVLFTNDRHLYLFLLTASITFLVRTRNISEFDLQGKKRALLLVLLIWIVGIYALYLTF